MLVCGVVLNLVLKSLVGRTRPASVNWLVSESGFSFPSGHATATAVLWSCSDVLDFHSAKMWQKSLSVLSVMVLSCLSCIHAFILVCISRRMYLVDFPWYSIGIYLTRRLFLSTKTIT